MTIGRSHRGRVSRAQSRGRGERRRLWFEGGSSLPRSLARATAAAIQIHLSEAGNIGGGRKDAGVACDAAQSIGVLVMDLADDAPIAPCAELGGRDVDGRYAVLDRQIARLFQPKRLDHEVVDRSDPGADRSSVRRPCRARSGRYRCKRHGSGLVREEGVEGHLPRGFDVGSRKSGRQAGRPLLWVSSCRKVMDAGIDRVRWPVDGHKLPQASGSS
jgi:hypothetical protein